MIWKFQYRQENNSYAARENYSENIKNNDMFQSFWTFPRLPFHDWFRYTAPVNTSKSVTNEFLPIFNLERNSMDVYLSVTNYVGSISTIVNGCFVIMIVVSPPDNLGIFRSQYYFGAFTSLLFAATQLWSANVSFCVSGLHFSILFCRSSTLMAHCYWCFHSAKRVLLDFRRFSPMWIYNLWCLAQISQLDMQQFEG